jgi:ABC-type uncharacterized transport system permease subunit
MYGLVVEDLTFIIVNVTQVVGGAFLMVLACNIISACLKGIRESYRGVRETLRECQEVEWLNILGGLLICIAMGTFFVLWAALMGALFLIYLRMRPADGWLLRFLVSV